jgi:cation diffusion facilitator family transporter
VKGAAVAKKGGIASAIGRDIVLYAALAANLGIAVAKFVAAAITGSSSMLTEGIHSLVDSGNELLLLYGKHRATRPPDQAHPFGYGRELYFWAFVVAVLIFAIGAGVSAYEGYRHFVRPVPLEDAGIAYIVLAVAAVLEGTSWVITVRAFDCTRGGLGWWQAIRASKDPSTLAVLFEDSAAMLGLGVAAVGIWASHAFGDARLDGVASMVIGVILALVAGLLAREAKGLLIGERAEPELVEQVRELLTRAPGIVAVNHVRTVHSAPDVVFAAVSAEFEPTLSMAEGQRLIEELEQQLKARQPRLKSIYIRPERRVDAATLPTP